MNLNYTFLTEVSQPLFNINDEQEKRMIKMSNKFTEQYPTLNFKDLQKQSNLYSTDDGCIHYKHLLTNKIYSWNFTEDEWEEHSVKYQSSLLDLFT